VRRLLISVVTLLLLSTVFVSTAQATPNGLFWLRCNPSHTLPDDPIVHPGMPGTSHLHEFFGNDTTDAFSTYSDMVGQSTTCLVADDTAGYWVPALLTSGGIEIAPLDVNAYYWGEKGKTQAFPADFKEIAGATVGTPVGPHVYYQCMGSDPTSYLSLPNCALTSGKHVKAQVEFPSCWDGVTAYDETSHMAYPNGDVCPADHSVYLPRLVVHVEWNRVDASSDHLASDPAMGFDHGESMHADFWNTWNQTRLESLVATCIFTGGACKNLKD
jgi:hypothetical protein